MSTVINTTLFLAVLKAQTAKLAESLISKKATKGEPGLSIEERNIREAYLAIGCGGSRNQYKTTVERQFKAEGKKDINPETFADDNDDDDETYEPIPFAVFVPIANPNGHNYPLGIPAAFYRLRNRQAVSLDDNVHNSMSLDIGAIRAATDQEVETFFERKFTRLLELCMYRSSLEDLLYRDYSPENVKLICEFVNA